jgi:MFS transporter, PHS family, inorganic phosphate transporter
LLSALDDSKVTRFQWKIMFVSGMGFFTDAYDLFVIGVVVALIKPEWHLSTEQISLLNSATLAASAAGAITFGRIADTLGRKRIYGYEVLILAIGALASAFAPTPGFIYLLVCRIILGIGIGGDYPVSATIMSEYSRKSSRGKMVSLVFAMQGAGLVLGPLPPQRCWPPGLSHDTTRPILVAFGAIPGLAVYSGSRPTSGHLWRMPPLLSIAHASQPTARSLHSPTTTSRWHCEVHQKIPLARVGP